MFIEKDPFDYIVLCITIHFDTSRNRPFAAKTDLSSERRAPSSLGYTVDEILHSRMVINS